MAADRADDEIPPNHYRDVQNTLGLVEPRLRSGDVVLDVGCGSAYVTWQLGRRHRGTILAVDIVDTRKRPTPHFALYDGVHLPFEDRSVDVVMLNFVLHHIPNETKPAVLADVHRVTRSRVIVLEDTPRNFIDRYFNRRHGEAFRRSIGSTAAYGFFSQTEWAPVFGDQGFRIVESLKIGRFARDRSQPYARSCFVLEKAQPGRASSGLGGTLGHDTELRTDAKEPKHG